MTTTAAFGELVAGGWSRLHPLRAVGVFALIVVLAFDRGGYFPSPWGWAILGTAWAAALALLSREALFARPALATAACLVGFVVWTGLSSFWSLSPTQSALETQRMAVYASVFIAAAAWVRRSPTVLLIGAWAAIVVVCAYSLLTRLVPDRFGVDYVGSGNRLASPVGYWNALGIFAAGGLILALGFAAESESRLVRALAGASVPGLLLAVYFTYSRGAWGCLAVGILVYVALSVRTLRLVTVLAAVAPWAAVAVWRASISHPLTIANPAIGQAAHAGHRVLALTLVLALGAGLTVLAVSFVDTRLVLSQRSIRLVRIVVAVAIVISLIGVVSAYGSPTTIVRKGWDRFDAGSHVGRGATLNKRLFSFSSTGRVRQWRVAWSEAKAHPLVGSGARTYEIYWNRERPVPSRIRDVHNLYLQVLAELGVIGLALLSGVFLIPLVCGIRARRRPLFASSLGLYSAYLIHAIVDWDWEITAVMIPFLICAAVLASPAPRRLPARIRYGVLGASLILAVGGIYTIAARLPLNRLDHALAKQQWAKAEAEAQQASDLAPWSSEPWLALGEAELTNGLTPQAQAALRTATRKDPNNWVTWWDLARATGDGEREDALLHVAELNPRAPKATGD